MIERIVGPCAQNSSPIERMFFKRNSIGSNPISSQMISIMDSIAKLICGLPYPCIAQHGVLFV